MRRGNTNIATNSEVFYLLGRATPCAMPVWVLVSQGRYRHPPDRDRERKRLLHHHHRHIQVGAVLIGPSGKKGRSKKKRGFRGATFYGEVGVGLNWARPLRPDETGRFEDRKK